MVFIDEARNLISPDIHAGAEYQPLVVAGLHRSACEDLKRVDGSIQLLLQPFPGSGHRLVTGDEGEGQAAIMEYQASELRRVTLAFLIL